MHQEKMVTTEAPELPELRVQLDHLAIMEHLVKTEDLDIQVQ